MSVLHVVTNPRAIASCLRAHADGDAILLIGDGVFGIGAVPEEHGGLWVLAEDAAERGVGFPAEATADYAKFVALVLGTGSSVTWS